MIGDAFIRDRAVAAWPLAWGGQNLRDILVSMGIDVDIPWKDLPKKTRDWILFTDEQPTVPVYAGFTPKETRQALRQKMEPSYMGTFTGARRHVMHSFATTQSAMMKRRAAQYMLSSLCPECDGKRLRREALAVTFEGYDIADMTRLPMARLSAIFTPYVIRSPHDIGWLTDLTVRRLMRQDAKTVPENMTLAAVREAYPLGDAKKVFVVSASGAYKGTLDLTAIHDGKHDKELDLTAGKLAKSPHLVLRPLQNVKTALNLFEVHQTEMLPVVETGEHGQIIGYMTEQYALRRYNQELERRRSADLGEKDLFSIVEPPIKGP